MALIGPLFGAGTRKTDRSSGLTWLPGDLISIETSRSRGCRVAIWVPENSMVSTGTASSEPVMIEAMMNGTRPCLRCWVSLEMATRRMQPSRRRAECQSTARLLGRRRGSRNFECGIERSIGSRGACSEQPREQTRGTASGTAWQNEAAERSSRLHLALSGGRTHECRGHGDLPACDKLAGSQVSGQQAHASLGCSQVRACTVLSGRWQMRRAEASGKRSTGAASGLVCRAGLRRRGPSQHPRRGVC